MSRDYGSSAATASTSPYAVVYCGIYARYSSDKQRRASIEDQIRNCRALAERKGWLVLDTHIYIDEDRTGQTLNRRDGFQAMMEATRKNPSDVQYIVVDDVSRFGRRKSELFKTIDILTFRKVYVYFVEDGLDSKEPWFEEAFHSKAQQASQYSKGLAAKTKRGREGRFIAGYNPGGGCYGYRNVPDEDLSRRGDYGRPAVVGVFQVVVPEQSAMVIRIFEAFASGMSLRQIAKMLNDEHIPPSQQARKRDTASWCKSAIKTILRNTRYIGKVTWGCTNQVMDPETGLYVRRDVPKSEWLSKDMPDLRIVSDELWNRVQEQFTLTTRGVGAKRLGGLTRTERSRKYLFGGLLRCGTCGGNMIVTTTKPTRYGCADRRHRDSCANRLTIRLDALEPAFMSALTAKLESDELREELVHGLVAHINSYRAAADQNRATAESLRKEHEETLRNKRIQRDNLVRAIAESGHSRGLLESLSQTEARIDRLEDLLQPVTEVQNEEIGEAEIRKFLVDNANRFLEILTGEPEFVRHELQKRITTITLTPLTDDRGPVYRVTGDIGLFSGGERLLLANQGDLIGQQQTLSLCFDIATKKPREKDVKIAA